LVKAVTPKLAFDPSQDFAAWQRKLRSKLKSLLGEMPTDRVPLKPCTLWTQKTELGTIEKVAFTSEQDADVLAYVCLPKDVKPPYTFVICLQGHSTGMHNSIGVELDDETKIKVIEGDRNFAIHCMQRGMAALCIEQRAFGYRAEKHQKIKSDQTCHDAAMHALMLGRTLAGERVWDVDRGIDYLQSRGDCNMKTIGIMGNSGGGSISTLAAATLPNRIAFAMPSCSTCTYAQSIMSIYHCADNYIPDLLNWAESGDIIGLIAPRPLVLVAGKEDEIFPLPGVKKAFKQVKAIYTAAGAPQNVKLVLGEGGHRFYAQPSWKAMLKLL
jgi:dienelactone hydrolase